jgi:formyltetrahydrofolate deformylase
VTEPDVPAVGRFILTLSCPDAHGIVFAVTGFLVEQDCNITESQQYGDADSRLFFLRMAFTCDAPARGLDELRARFHPLAVAFAMNWSLTDATVRPRVLLMVSKYGHCLNDLLYRQSSGALHADIPAIVSNHRDFAPLAASHGIPFHHIPVTPATKAAAESAVQDIIAREGIEVVVLARYMQVLSDDFCRPLAGRIINIHHSLLPSFKGANPYRQAFARGVKLVGATAHYVTADLDEGPIIEQDVAHVDHSFDVAALAAAGRDVEAQVLARAVRWHTERRILRNGSRTVVFRG